MTLEEAEKEYENEAMSWYAPYDEKGAVLFSFDDEKSLFSVFRGAKNELTEE